MNPRNTRIFILLFVAAIVGSGSYLYANSREPGATISVTTYNIGGLDRRRPSTGEVIDALGAKGIADIVLLQEVAGEKQAEKIADGLSMPHWRFERHRKNFHGVAVLSRYPLGKASMFRFGKSAHGYGALAVEVTAGDRRLLVCSVHLDRIEGVKVAKQTVHMKWAQALDILKNEVFEDTPRSRSVDELLDWLNGFDASNVIVGGDFNTVFPSRAIRRMTRVYNDALWPSAAYFTGSFNRSPFFISPRIDYLFVSPTMKSRKRCVVKSGAGDHYPVRVDVGFGSG